MAPELPEAEYEQLEAVRTGLHRKLTPLPPSPPHPLASGQVVRSEKCGPVALAL